VTERVQRTETKVRVGDAAADGLLKGIVAGVVMAAYLALVGLVVGKGLGTVLARFAPTEGGSAVTGILVHLGVSAVYGALFGVGWHVVRRRRLDPPPWLAGLAYGVVLLVVAEVALLVGAESPLRGIPLVHFAAAHVIYGVGMGLLMREA
jgi:hypothetical protein